MRRWLSFDVAGTACAATLDVADGRHGLLIVSGGNEIRSGAHRGMARLAGAIAARGHPVLRFDRRGVGDSEGKNGGFESSADDIAAAVALFRARCPNLSRITAFGNCDAASALVLHHRTGGPDALLLANPWTIDPAGPGAAVADAGAAVPDASIIRARYAAKLKDPREWLRLLRGGVDLGKLWRGLAAARQAPAASQLAESLRQALGKIDVPVTILIADRDATAMAFMRHWHSSFDNVVDNIWLQSIDSASHSFSDAASGAWLDARVLEALTL